MKVLLSIARGGPEDLVLGEIPRPEAGVGEVLIRVQACAVNYPDLLMIEDRYQFAPERPFTPGAEVGGTVEAVGGGVSGFSPGDRVMAGGLHGGLAEYVAMPASRTHRIPDVMPFEEAAAFLMTFGTAQHALKDRAGLARGEVLAVLGAAGGVGLAAIQIGKHLGARVVAAVSTAEKAQVALAHGADDAVVYPAGPMDRAAAKAFGNALRTAGGGHVDVVYDAVGGQYSEPALRTLARGGRFLVVGFAAGIAQIPLNLPLLKSCQIVGVFWGSFIEQFPEANRRNVAELIDWYRQGVIRPRISERFPLERGGDAIARLGKRAAIGKVVVTMPVADPQVLQGSRSQSGGAV